MTTETIESVRDSWSKVAPFAGAAAAIFFDRLLEQDPAFRRVFPENRRGMHIAEFNRFVTLVVRSLGRLETVAPAAVDLGRRASWYGLGEDDYRTVADAFLWSLGRVLGAELTPAVRRAWNDVFLDLLAAARRASAPARSIMLAGVVLAGPPPAVALC